ncbi:MAG TPA: DUF1326 domain-containing protein [Alphaproteobacteria bacterium]|nr:DUF1326 domain-containing protein [Alphaproteobacteria bacterium]
MAYVDWRIKGTEFTNCNCAWGCPCQFNALPTNGFCHAFSAMRIDEGHFGKTKLDGLCWAVTFRWPGPVHLGNGTEQVFIDERADHDQREALTAILHGKETEPGATHFFVFNSMCSTVLQPQFARIEVDIDQKACRARIAVPGLIESVGRPIPNPFTGGDHRVRVSLERGFEYVDAEYGSGTTAAKGAVPLDFKDTHSHVAYLHMTQNGVVR